MRIKIFAVRTAVGPFGRGRSNNNFRRRQRDSASKRLTTAITNGPRRGTYWARWNESARGLTPLTGCWIAPRRSCGMPERETVRRL
jgi:hypothetical protein